VYHDALHEAIADEKRALAQPLDGVPWPRPSYAGIPAVTDRHFRRERRLARDDEAGRL
jgi:hypothetical protein